MAWHIAESTGVHTVADVFCVGCGDRLGWYYHKASDQSQKYKEGESPLMLHGFSLSSGCRKVPSRARAACQGQRVDVGYVIRVSMCNVIYLPSRELRFRVQ